MLSTTAKAFRVIGGGLSGQSDDPVQSVRSMSRFATKLHFPFRLDKRVGGQWVTIGKYNWKGQLLMKKQKP
jgi:hypothetical protein